MKKLVCILAVAVMLCSFVLSAAAADSPVASEYPNPPTPTTTTVINNYYYTNGSTPAPASAGGSTGNTSSTAPKTGAPLPLLIGLGVLALGTGALAVKKIKE